MWIDNQLSLSAAQAITVDAPSTNVIDTTTARDIGSGQQPLFLVIQVTTAFAAGGTITISLRSAATTDLTSSPTTHWSTGDQTKTTYLPLGKVLIVALPPDTYKRYLGLYFDVTTSETAGVVDAFLTPTPQKYVAYATGTTF